MIGQTAEIVPADKKMYALRDVTGTVESPPLICASIMSKKLAEGIDALVLDVKIGSGAFMKRPEDAERLARMMVDTARPHGQTRRCAHYKHGSSRSVSAVGNSLEVRECLEIMMGEQLIHDLHPLTRGTGRLDVLSGRCV